VVKFGFYPSKFKKQPFLPIISKSRGAKAPLRRLCMWRIWIIWGFWQNNRWIYSKGKKTLCMALDHYTYK